MTPGMRSLVGISLILMVTIVVAGACLTLVWEVWRRAASVVGIEVTMNEHPPSMRTYPATTYDFAFAVAAGRSYEEVTMAFSVLWGAQLPVITAGESDGSNPGLDQIAEGIPALRAWLSAFPDGYTVESIEVDSKGDGFDALMFDFTRAMVAAVGDRASHPLPSLHLLCVDGNGSVTYYEGVSGFCVMRAKTLQSVVKQHNDVTTRYAVLPGEHPGSVPLAQAPDRGSVTFPSVRKGDRLSVAFSVSGLSAPLHKGLIHVIRIYGDGDLVGCQINEVAWEGPVVIAHRGASGQAPENTLSSIERALEFGATMVEIDVHTTKDGEIVLIHDSDVSRTTDGTGLVSSLTLEEIRSLDAGSWFGPGFSGERVPTLDEALEAVSGKAILCIENKQADPLAVIRKAEAHDALDQVMIFDFDHARLRQVRQIEGRIKTVALGPTLQSLGSLDRSVVDVAGASLSEMDEFFVEEAHDLGLAVFIYTVNAEQDMRRLLGYGVDGIITDHPGLASHLIASSSKG